MSGRKGGCSSQQQWKKSVQSAGFSASLTYVRPMEEPDGCINADAETMLAGRIGVEAMRGQMHI